MKNKVSFFLFIVILLSLSVSFLIIPARRFSETENRTLNAKVEVSYENFISGELGEDLETYLKDQFVLKDRWINLKWGVDQLLGKTENNDVLINDGYLFNKNVEITEDYQKRLEIIDDFADRADVSVYFIMAPVKELVYPEMLPVFYENRAMTDIYDFVDNYDYADNLTYIEVMDNICSNKDEYLYYKTDHHWTQRGAYYAYEEFAAVIGVEPLTSDIQLVEDEFKGTYYAKSGVVNIAPDEIEIFENNDNLSVYHNKKQFDDVYFDKHLHRYDKYKYFLDGNHPRQKIINEENDNNRKLLVIKDSYANSFIPLITSHYEEIHVLDLRYFDEDVENYMSENKITEVLFLYNIDTFSDEEGLGIRKLGE